MKVEKLGEETVILREVGMAPHQAAAAIRRAGIPGVTDAWASYETVGVRADLPIETSSIEAALADPALVETRVHSIPVWYETGEDMPDVADRLKLAPEEIVRAHSDQEYECFAVGFQPGFGYLGWLPDQLSGVPRRPSPRPRVAAGSVAITGRQTAVYPSASPGGWAIIGRTPLILVDVRDGYFPLQAGDRVRFTAIDASEYERLQGQRL